jgi:hypothetical protein
MLRHVVLFAFRTDTSLDEVKSIEQTFAVLPAAIPEIAGFEWGTDVSVENLAQGYTHCFVVTFRSEQDRDVYLPHPAHQAFVALVGPHIEKVLVVDFWARK